MCLIIYREKKQFLSKDFLEDVYNRNSHGWGIMYRDRNQNNKVVTHRGMTYKSFEKLYRKLEAYKNLEMVIHFRYATHGEKTIDNCHPFKVIDDVYLMHNGIIDIDIPKEDAKTHSDTKVFVRDVLRPLLKSVNDVAAFLRGKAFKHIMTSYCADHNSRLAIMDTMGPVFFGGWFETEKGIWVSNQYAYSVDNKQWAKTWYPKSKPQSAERNFNHSTGRFEVAGHNSGTPYDNGYQDGYYDGYNGQSRSTQLWAQYGYSKALNSNGDHITPDKVYLSSASLYEEGYEIGFEAGEEAMKRELDIPFEDEAIVKERDPVEDEVMKALDDAVLAAYGIDGAFEAADEDTVEECEEWLEQMGVDEQTAGMASDLVAEGRLYFIQQPNRIVTHYGDTVFPFVKPAPAIDIKQAVKAAYKPLMLVDNQDPSQPIAFDRSYKGS